MERLKYNTPYPKEKLRLVPSGTKLQLVATIRSFCLIREDEKK